MFRRLFIVFPDLRVAVRRVSVIDYTVFVEPDAAATFGRRPIGHLRLPVLSPQPTR